MQFSDVLSDIEKLVDKQLQSINPNTDSIYITEFDRDAKRYYISSKKGERGNARSFWELEDIWSELVHKGFSNVDQALYGSGSRRNQPETIFANLPYIQHFKYKKRKHILLRDTHVHNPGTLSELTIGEQRVVRRRINNFFEIDTRNLHSTISLSHKAISDSLDSVFKKFPGDVLTRQAEHALNMLEEQVQVLKDAIVTIDGSLETMSLTVDATQRSAPLSVNELLDDQLITGIENEDVIEIEQLVEDEDVIEEKSAFSHNKPQIRQYTPVVSLIFDRLQYDEIELQPDFQRKDRIWTHTQKSKLIESVLMGLPIPAFYFGEKVDGTWVVVDGLQRITTLYDFLSSSFELINLDFLPEYNQYYFKDLNRTQQRQLREYQVTANVIELNSNSEGLITELFHRINTYGVHLSNQEIRNALYQGTSTRFLRFVAGSEQFKNSTRNKIKSYRQKDMELCLSAISFIYLGYENFGKNYDDFFNTALYQLNQKELTIFDLDDIDSGYASIGKPSSQIYINLWNMLKSGLDFAIEIFGDAAFQKYVRSNATINRTLFELVVTYFSNLSLQEKEIIRNKSSEFVNCFYQAIATDSCEYATWKSGKHAASDCGFSFSITTSVGRASSVNYRFEAFREILKKSTGIVVNLKPVIENN